MLFGTTAQAARICVPSSFDGSCNSSQASIAAAITAATSGVDDIYVQAGTYVENIDYSNKNITILSASGAATTILQKSVNAPIVNFNNAALTSAAVLDGFTLQNGNTGCLARGIYIGSGATPTIRNSIVKGNTPGCSSVGAGIYITASGATIDNVTVGVSGTPNTTAGNGGGIYITGAGQDVTITNSTISYNTSGNQSGGIWANSTSGTLTISNSSITYNTGTNISGGLYLSNKSGTTTINSNTIISNNSSGQSGAGIYSTGSALNIDSSTISNNTVNNASQHGGGMYLTGAAAIATVTNTNITGNSNNGAGGGVYIAGAATLNMTGGSLSSNVAGTNTGGGVSATGAGTVVTLTKVIVSGNDTNQYGGGIYLNSSASVTLTNCFVTGNTADTQTYSDGGGIYNTGATLVVMNSTIAGNYAKRYGGGLSGLGTVTNSIFWGNTADTSGPQIYSTPTVTYSDISGGFAGTGNIDNDPLFVTPAQAVLNTPTTAGDFHLQSTSPAEGGGTATGAPADDIDGDARSQGSGFDMGADEIVPTGTNSTTVGAATAVNAGAFYIDVSMPYTDDINGNNTYTVDYKLSSEPTVWTNWVTAAAHVVSPYTTTITGLTQGESYDVRVTYNDADTVTGTNPQTITNIVTAPIVRAVPGTYATIQAAIDASNNGDTIQVANGTYSENINFNNKLVTVISQNGAALTKIQGTGANSPVVTFSSGETSSAVLDGFTIDNQAAAGTNSNGIKITASSAPTLQNLIVEGNNAQAGYYGGGIYINGGTATIQNSTLGSAAKPNTAGSGGGALYATALSAPLNVSNSTFSYNTSDNGGAVYLTANGAQTTTFSTVTFSNNSTNNHGGAIYNDGSKLTINSSSAFNTNTTAANMNGGAINIVGAASSVTISNTTFTSNSSGSYGGAISISGSTDASPLTITGSTFTTNGTASTLYGGSIALITVTNPAVISSTTITGGTVTNRGGNIYASAAPMTLTSVDVTNGTSSLEGGGMYLTGAATVVNMTGGSLNGNTGTTGGGAFITSATLNTYSGTTISSNLANSSTGGGLLISGGTVALNKTILSGNRANQRGGGISISTGSATLTNSNVTGNSADMQAYSNGGGIYDAGGTVTLMNTTVAGNYATSSAGGFAAAGADDVVTNSIFWGNTAGATPEITGTPTVTYSDVSGGFAGTGNINNDPLFVSLAQASSGNPTTAGNFHIQSTSPAKNIGTATGAPADDIDGDARPQAGGYDMGSDEIPGNSTTLATGTDPGNASLAPGGAATMADAFTLQTSAGTDVITNVTVTLAAGTSAGLSLVEITDTTGGILYGQASNPASDTPVITLSISTLTATTTATTYKIRVTPKSHANMPAPAGASYAVTAYISDWTGTNNHLGSDTGGTTVTIDNLSPDNVTAATATPGSAQVVLDWTNPGDGDLHSIVVLRRATSAVADVPVEGTTYVVGNTIGTATVACVVASPTATCTDTGLTNGTAYHYLIFAKDTNGNYSATGVVPTGSPATPQDAQAPADTIDLGVTSSTTSSITLGWTAPGDDGSSGTATTYDVRYSTSPINDGNWASATAATGEPAPQVAGTTESFTVTGLSAGTTYYFAMKTSDEIPNTSGLSNNAIGTTNFNGTTVILHPSGAAAGNGATFTGGTAATALDTNDGNTSYGASSISTNDFYLDLDDTALSGTISSVQVKTQALKVNIWQTANFTVGLKTNGSSYFGASNSATTSYALYSGNVYNTNPQSTAAWTWTEINNLVAIINLTSNASFRATELYAEVAYTPADLTAPAAVTLTASASAPTDTSVKLTWNAPGDDGSTGTASIYDIRYSTSPINDGNWASATKVSGEPTPSIAGTAETFTVTGLAQSTTYYFAIKTADEVPNWSTISNSPSFATTAPDVTAPAAVTLSTGTITDTSIQLNWTAPGDDNNDPGTTATTYDVRYSTSAINAGNWASATQATGEPAPSVQGTAESFTVTGLSSSTTYYFAIKTGDEVVQWSAVSNSPSAVTLSSDAIPPADTIDLDVTAWTTSSLTVSWTSPGDDGSSGTATTYDIRYSTSPITAGNWASATQATGEPAPLVAGTSQSLNITGLAAGTLYYFAMKTSDEVPNTSGLSNIAVGTTTYNGSTVTLHPSGANALDSVTYSSSAATDLDGTDGTFGSSLTAANDFYLDIDDTALTGTINSVQVKAVANCSDGGWGACPATFTLGLRTNATNYLDAGHSPANTTYTTYSGNTYATNPNTGSAWTWTQINALIGVADHTNAADMRINELYVDVVYTPGDTTAPDAVSTLATSNITDTSVKLTWTAPGDDASTGTATTYDIRYSTSAINDGNWASATKVSGEPAPAVAGTTTENYTVTGLTPNTTYYFAIKTADEVPNWSAISNSPSTTTLERPVGGYTADNVIPTAQVTQATDGSGLMTITWKGRDGQAQNVTLKTFQYSIDGGSTWNAPTNADASAALSANWTNNGGGGWTTATTFGAASAHSFTFNTKHADVTGINGTDQSDIRVRFTLNDGGIDSTSPATSENFRVDDLSPTSTIVSAVYDAGNDRMTITGTNFLTIAAATTDIKSYVDWTKFVWDINGDDATTANITFVVGDVTSLTVTDDTTLTLQFTGAKGTAIEATAGYGMAGGADTLDVTAGFIKDYYGNAATTDGVANAPLLTTLISGTVYTNDEVTLVDPGSTVRLLINGASAGTAVTDGSSVYRIFANVAAGDAILAYIDNDATYAGTTVSVAGSANITDFHLYNDHIITRHDNGGSLTNANMGTAKGAYVDTDIRYSVSGSALTVSGANTELHVHDGYTFAPGGDVTTTDMTIHGTLTGGSGSITINGDLLIEAGVFTATSGTTTVSGNITNSAGTFTHSSGTVVLNGTTQSILGSSTFNNLSKTVAAADTLYFEAGSTTTVTGTATLQGASGQLLSLQSTVPTTYWNFTLGAASTKAISYVSVTDSDASGSDASKKPVSPTNSTDGGHNVSWFSDASLMFLKTVAVTSDPYNAGTNPKYIPGAEALFTMRVTNSGAGTVDNNTLIITDPVPANIELFTGNLSGGAPFIFADGTPVSGLSCAFIGLGDFTDCIDFSNDGGSTWTFVPNGSFDPAVTNIRFSLSGTMNGTGGGNPYFDLSFRVRVK